MGVPTLDDAKGLAESMEICSYACAIGPNKAVSPATGRKDVADWLDRVGPTRKALERPRLIKMPVGDFADPRDVEYSKWTHMRQGFDYDEALASTPALLADLKILLLELETMLRGRGPDGPTLNSWQIMGSQRRRRDPIAHLARNDSDQRRRVAAVGARVPRELLREGGHRHVRQVCQLRTAIPLLELWLGCCVLAPRSLTNASDRMVSLSERTSQRSGKPHLRDMDRALSPLIAHVC